jgi:hypothetical protein
MCKRGERKQVFDGRRGKKVQNVLLGERKRAHMEWMYRNEREGEKGIERKREK